MGLIIMSNTVKAKRYQTKEGHLVFSAVLQLPDGNIFYETRPGDSFVIRKEAFDKLVGNHKLAGQAEQQEITIEKPGVLLTLEQQQQQQQQTPSAAENTNAEQAIKTELEGPKLS